MSANLRSGRMIGKCIRTSEKLSEIYSTKASKTFLDNAIQETDRILFGTVEPQGSRKNIRHRHMCIRANLSSNPKRGAHKGSSLLSRVYFNTFYEGRLLLVKITVNLRRLMPDEDTASSTPQPAYKTGITISLLFFRKGSSLLLAKIATYVMKRKRGKPIRVTDP